MIRSLLNFLAFNAFIMLLPIFCLLAWGWGSPDEKWLMRVAFCALSPFCAVMWYFLLSYFVFHRKASYLALFMVLVGGYAGIFMLLRSGVIAF
jgi:glucan phosphoethanolaminetransferase (alkaline phosphatase superfamily)